MAFQTQAYTVYEAGRPIRLEQVFIDDVKEGEVLVETVAFSVCATDAKAAAGKFLLKPPMILGHEASGIVLHAPPTSNLKPGSKVILTYSSCGTCPTCSSHASPYCHDLSALNFSGRRKDGSSAIKDSSGNELNHFFFGQSSMGRHVLAQETSIVKLPDDTSIEDLRKFASLGCGIQTGAGAIVNVCSPPPSSTIAILGAGSVGLSAALAALTSSPKRIILIDNDSRKFSLVPTALQASERIVHIDSSKLPAPSDGIAPLTTAIKDATSGIGADFVLDCVGLPSLIEASIPALARKGTMITVGGGAPGVEAKVRLMDMLIGGRSWRGTHQGDSVPGEFLPRLIGMWKEGKFGFDELLTMYGFEDLERAMEDVKKGKTVKAVLAVK
ncbi:chaperonin 10-like protein [Elsinoe ampelina]|uniref:Chaperonin 10-like protein n=1 Tax=Elsinoe ampelina TaxID=302913 RepID=A0A6A6G0G4_9PEZI|nr:chaperonin 10-like protein [Elsinoe ampelina]